MKKQGGQIEFIVPPGPPAFEALEGFDLGVSSEDNTVFALADNDTVALLTDPDTLVVSKETDTIYVV